VTVLYSPLRMKKNAISFLPMAFDHILLDHDALNGYLQIEILAQSVDELVVIVNEGILTLSAGK